MEDDDPIPTPTSKATAAAVTTATTTLPKGESAETVDVRSDRRPDHNHMIRESIQ